MGFYIINIILLALLAYWLYRRTLFLTASRFFWPLLGLKLLAGIGLGLVYKYYYSSGDTYAFFNAGVKLAELAKTDFPAYLDFIFTSDSAIISLGFTWVPNILMAKITSLFCLMTGGTYWLVSLYFSLIVFAALWHLFMQLSDAFRENDLAIMVSLFIVPSVVFWSSGLSKESVLVTAMAIILSSFIKVHFNSQRFSLSDGIISIFTLVLLWKLKYFYAGVLVVMLSVFHFMKWLSGKFSNLNKRQISGLTIISFFLLLAITSLAHPNFYPSRILEVIIQNHDDIAAKTDPAGMIHFEELRPTVGSFLYNFPLALFSGLFRPLFWETYSILTFATGLENFILLSLTVWSLFHWPKWPQTNNLTLFISSVLYMTVLAVLLALSTPNFGTLMRFKVGFLPFFYLVVLYNNPFFSKLSKRFVSDSGEAK